MSSSDSLRLIFRSDIDKDDIPDKRLECARLLTRYYVPGENYYSYDNIADKAEPNLNERPDTATVSRAKRDLLKEVPLDDLDKDPLASDHPILDSNDSMTELQAMYEYLEGDDEDYDAHSFVAGWVAGSEWASNNEPR